MAEEITKIEYLEISDDEVKGETLVADLPNRPNDAGMTAADLKERFDRNSELLRARFNNLIALLGTEEIIKSLPGMSGILDGSSISLKKSDASDPADLPTLIKEIYELISFSLSFPEGNDVTKLSELAAAITSGNLAKVLATGSTNDKLKTLSALVTSVTSGDLADNIIIPDTEGLSLSDFVALTKSADFMSWLMIDNTRSLQDFLDAFFGGSLAEEQKTGSNVSALETLGRFVASVTSGALAEVLIVGDATTPQTLGEALTELNVLLGLKLAISQDEDFKYEFSLKDENGKTYGEPITIDLPLEELVVSGKYIEIAEDAELPEGVSEAGSYIVLTLRSKEELYIPLGSLIANLANKDDLKKKLDKFVISEDQADKEFVYTQSSEGEDGAIELSIEADPNTVVKRDADGNVRANDVILDDGNNLSDKLNEKVDIVTPVYNASGRGYTSYVYAFVAEGEAGSNSVHEGPYRIKATDQAGDDRHVVMTSSDGRLSGKGAKLSNETYGDSLIPIVTDVRAIAGEIIAPLESRVSTIEGDMLAYRNFEGEAYILDIAEKCEGNKVFINKIGGVTRKRVCNNLAPAFDPTAEGNSAVRWNVGDPAVKSFNVGKLSKGTYSWSVPAFNDSSKYRVWMDFSNVDGGGGGEIDSTTFTLDAEADIVFYVELFYNLDGSGKVAVYTSMIFKLMLNKGETVLQYEIPREEYVYPKLVDTRVTAIKAASRNLLDVSKMCNSFFVDNGDGTYTFTKGTNSDRFTPLVPINVPPHTPFSVSVKVLKRASKGHVAMQAYLKDSSGSAQTAWNSDTQNVTRSYAFPITGVRLYLGEDVPQGESFILSDIQVWIGKEYTSYTPYYSTVDTLTIPEHTYLLPTQSGYSTADDILKKLKLLGVGVSNERYNYLKFENDKASFHKLCEKIIFNGAEAWGLGGSDGTLLKLEMPLSLDDTQPVLSNILEYSTVGPNALQEGQFCFTPDSIYIRSEEITNPDGAADDGQRLENWEEHLRKLNDVGSPFSIVYASSVEEEEVTDVTPVLGTLETFLGVNTHIVDNSITVLPGTALTFENAFNESAIYDVEYLTSPKEGIV